MKPFKFIHASDLHLDSQFKGRSSEMPDEILSVLRNSTFLAYENIIDLCLERKVDALLIAGDVYDGAERSFKAQARFISGLSRLDANGIRSFVCHGNHDPLNGWQASLEFPGSCYRYGEKAETFPLLGDSDRSVLVHGISYPRRDVRNNLIPHFESLERGSFNIGLIHANVGRDTGHDTYAPCELSDLIETGYNYWALGHVHTRKILNDQLPTVVYPGNTQGRQINEDGPRGVYLVEVDEYSTVSTEFIPTDVVRWQSLRVDATEMETLQVFRDRVYQGLGNLKDNAGDRSLVVRIRVDGSSPLHGDLSRKSDMEDLKESLNQDWGAGNPFLWCEKLEIATSPPIDREQMAKGTDFIGELLRLTDQIQSDPGELSVLLGEASDIYAPGARVGKHLKTVVPGIEDMADLITEAERIYLTELMAGGEK